MDRLAMTWNGAALSFEAAKRLADSTAAALLEEPVLLSWYDRPRDIESPAGVNECHRDCPTPGYIDYAANRGGALVVDIGGGEYVFCYRPLAEFG